MLKEDLAAFVDGRETEEKEVATVIRILGNTVILQDNADNIFFLDADPSAFEVGTVELRSGLTPVDEAAESLKKKIYAALEKEEK